MLHQFWPDEWPLQMCRARMGHGVRPLAELQIEFIAILLGKMGLSGILCGRPISLLSHEPFAEDDGELGACLRPFPRWPFPVLRSMVENKV